MGLPSLKIGPYYLGKTLGIGSFGKVKIGEHEIYGQKVAVKILNKKKICFLGMNLKVKREIELLKIFIHPHIIRLFEVIYTKSDIFMVTEYINGGELFDYIIENGKLSENASRKFFQQMISGIEYCHKKMVIHRDLKPENLLLDSHLNIKIADFGLSNVIQNGVFLKTSCGSPNYAAPEIISGNQYLGPEVDIWSCGIILYALLCGSLPFDDENIPKLFRKIKGGIYILPGHLSNLSKDLISKMLITNPLVRISIYEIKEHLWFQIRLPKYLSSFKVKKKKFNRRKIDENHTMINTVSNKIKFGKKIIRLAVEKKEYNFITINYHLITEKITPFETIKIDNSEKISSKRKNKNILEKNYKNKIDLKNKKSWILGIKGFKEYPYEIIKEIYRSTSILNWHWQRVSSFHIVLSVVCSTHWPFLFPSKFSEQVSTSLKIGVQLFTGKSKFILDFSRLDGDIVGFFNFFISLKEEMKFS